MKALGNEVPTYSHVMFIYPGKWFAGIFKGLSPLEKVGWVKRLSIALVTRPRHGSLLGCVFRRFRPPSPSEGGQCRSGATLGMTYVPEWPD